MNGRLIRASSDDMPLGVWVRSRMVYYWLSPREHALILKNNPDDGGLVYVLTCEGVLGELSWTVVNDAEDVT